MSYINIKTTQNVEITYEAASLLDRILAFFLDLLIIGILFFCSAMISFMIIGSTFSNKLGEVFMILLSIIIMFYSFISETVGKGTSLGKRALKLKIIKLDGKEPQIGDYLIRWLFRFIDIVLSAGALAMFFIVSGKYKQRIGDLIANTTIIKTSFNNVLNVDALEKIKKDESVVFTQAKLLNEEFALLIKNVLDRYKDFPSQTNYDMLEETKNKLIQEIDFEEVENYNTKQFLQTVLKDYIILTR